MLIAMFFYLNLVQGFLFNSIPSERAWDW
jgi:hypothetical protein